MRRGGPMKRSPMRKRSRSASEFARVYGSKERVEWVKSLPCVGCGIGPSVNAHTVGGGTSRKADAETIAPLCHWCHLKYDQHRAPFDTEASRALMIVAAVRTDLLWRERTGDAA